MAQLVKGLLCDHEDLSLVFRTCLNMQPEHHVSTMPLLGRYRQEDPQEFLAISVVVYLFYIS